MSSTYVNVVNRDTEDVCSWLSAQFTLRTSQILLAKLIHYHSNIASHHEA
jgi:hypothetical protein